MVKKTELLAGVIFLLIGALLQHLDMKTGKNCFVSLKRVTEQALGIRIIIIKIMDKQEKTLKLARRYFSGISLMEARMQIICIILG